MDNLIEIIEYRGYKVKIYQDLDPMNPVKEFDMMGTMVCCHKQYTLGHMQFSGGAEAVCNTMVHLVEYHESIVQDYYDMLDSAFIEKYMSKLHKLAIVLPLFLLDHSGISISTNPFNDYWDSGQIGFIYAPIYEIKKENNWKLLTKKRRQQIIDCLTNEVKTYDEYLRGEVYGYDIEDIDSCWGFFGYNFELNGMKDEWEGAIDHHIYNINQENILIYAKEIGDISQLIDQ